MRRINFLALVILILGALALSVSLLKIKNSGSVSAAAPQAPTTTLRRVAVNARTISALPAGKKYTVDLTQHGVKYEFDPKAGLLDFSRVVVRTTQGEVAIGPFLEKMIPREKRATFKYASQSFSLATRPSGTVPKPSTNLSKIIACGSTSCVCSGSSDCFDMVFGGTFGGKEYCQNGGVLCSEDEDGTIWCTCYKA